jgi:hypothetical protein
LGAIKEMKKHPSNTPLEEWPQGWLVLEIANISGRPFYLVMTDEEKEKEHLPITEQEMREYILAKQLKK